MGRVPLSQSVSNDLNGVETDTGNISRTVVLRRRILLPSNPLIFNRRGRGRGGQDGLLSYRRNVLPRCFYHCSFTVVLRRFWVLMFIGRSPPWHVVSAVAFHELRRRGLESFVLVLDG